MWQWLEYGIDPDGNLVSEESVDYPDVLIDLKIYRDRIRSNAKLKQ
jgi:hypothetical protein